jgi:catechol 2,3-dioxygenase-like lactoylglutathione lyase family enzyme
METRALDHVNLAIPADGVDDAVDFYRDRLGFDLEDLAAFRAGDRPLFTVRLGDTAVIHLSPDESFSPPTGENYVHVCFVLEGTIEEIRDLAERADLSVERESNPLGATGRARALYVTDPFGYTLELKAGA